MTVTDELSALARAAFEGEGFDAAFGEVRVSDRPDLAQFQCNGALAAAKIAKTNPREVAGRIAARLKESGVFADVSIAGPGFINLTLTNEDLAERFVAAFANGVGAWRDSAPERLVIDYGGPNVAKPLHVGHLRSAIIGECLKRLFRASGSEVVADVHLGDWGLPMGQLITELAREQPSLPYFDAHADGPFPSEPPISLADLERLYPQASSACKSDPERLEEAREATAALQAGRPGYRALWAHFIAVSRAALEREYADLGVSFDLWKGEADADPLIAPMAEALRAKGVVETNDGAEIIRVARDDDKKDVPPLILFKSDGSVLYGTTDLATILDRKRVSIPTAFCMSSTSGRRCTLSKCFARRSAAASFLAIGLSIWGSEQ